MCIRDSIGGGTLPKISWRKTYLNFRNNFILLYKNLPDSWLIRVFAMRLLLDSIAAMKFLIQAGFKDFWAVARAHFSFYRTLSKSRQKRKSMKQGSVRNIYKGSLVFDYFILRKKKFSQLKPSKFIH